MLLQTAISYVTQLNKFSYVHKKDCTNNNFTRVQNVRKKSMGLEKFYEWHMT